MSTLGNTLSQRMDSFDKHLQALLQDDSAKNVHQFRIACRELLAGEKVLRTIDDTKFWRKRTRKLLKSLNALRDLQQMREHLQDHPAVCNIIDTAITETRIDCDTRLRTLINSRLYERMAHTKAILLKNRKQENQLQAAWQATWQKALARTKLALTAANCDDVDSLHQLRIRYKQLRYLAELDHDANPAHPLDRKLLKNWQTRLGEIQDYRVMHHIAEQLDLPVTLQTSFWQQARVLAAAFLHNTQEFASVLEQLDTALTQRI